MSQHGKNKRFNSEDGFEPIHKKHNHGQEAMEEHLEKHTPKELRPLRDADDDE